MISVVNYGVSNVASMVNMLKRIGAPARVISSSHEAADAEKIILPGVGAFDHGIAALEGLGLTDVLRRKAMSDRVPILGVCLGMQMLADRSEEGTAAGLGLITGTCVRFRAVEYGPLKIPHMGWGGIAIQRQSALFDGLKDARFYFVHSYHLVPERPADLLATATYGVPFAAAVGCDNVFGVQFHPEKSHRFGMALLKNFADL